MSNNEEKLVLGVRPSSTLTEKTRVEKSGSGIVEEPGKKYDNREIQNEQQLELEDFHGTNSIEQREHLDNSQIKHSNESVFGQSSTQSRKRKLNPLMLSNSSDRKGNTHGDSWSDSNSNSSSSTTSRSSGSSSSDESDNDDDNNDGSQHCRRDSHSSSQQLSKSAVAPVRTTLEIETKDLVSSDFYLEENLEKKKFNDRIEALTVDSSQMSDTGSSSGTDAIGNTSRNQEIHTTQSHQQQKQNQRQQQKTDNQNPQDILPQQQQNRHYQHHSTNQQPEGWRVKLYRLNVDGSWDDCGTGRIVCLYRSPKNLNKKVPSPPPITPGSNSTANSADVDQWLYQETGEATLCVHAEMAHQQHSSNNTDDANNPSASKNKSDQSLNRKEPGESTDSQTQQQDQQQPQVLLRTRILLQDAYQRQGDNIITWCEPYCAPNQKSNFSTGNDNNNCNNDKIKGTYNGNENDRSSSSNKDAGVDLALSFQDNAGCLDIWRQITQVQGMAAFLLRQRQQQQPQDNGGVTPSVEDMAAQAAANHHANLQREQHEKNSILWNRQPQNSLYHQQQPHYTGDDNRGGPIEEYDSNDLGYVNDGVNNIHGGMMGHHPQSLMQQQWLLPSKPTLENLVEIGDVIASFQHVAQQRETLVTWMIADDCLYLKNLLNLFPSAEDKGDYSKLATLAACVKCILLLNDSSILEWIVNDSAIFEQVCSSLEYDPDLREKANHRWFLRERAKFRTVVPMEDPKLISLIHRAFRVTYIRDTLLRPTMDESSLSTLSSLLTFTHNEVVTLVATSRGDNNTNQNHVPVLDNNSIDQNQECAEILKGSYMLRVMRLLAVEGHVLASMEWSALEAANSVCKKTEEKQLEGIPTTEATNYYNIESNRKDNDDYTSISFRVGEESGAKKFESDPSIVIPNLEEETNSTKWKQYLAPQDGSIESRRLRRRGCIGFLRELFNMVRMSLQQCDKDDFFPAVCSMDIELVYPICEEAKIEDSNRVDNSRDTNINKLETSENVSQTSHIGEEGRRRTSQSFGSYIGMSASGGRYPGTNVNVNTDAFFVPPTTTFLAVLADCLSDPNIDDSEKGYVLEIVRGITLQDPALIRRHCIATYRSRKRVNTKHLREGSSSYTGRPEPNVKKQVVNFCPPGDLVASLLFLLAVETDAGILLQVSEVLRFVLDTDMISDPGSSVPPSQDIVSATFDDQLENDSIIYPVDKEGNQPSTNVGISHDQHSDLNQVRFNEQKLFLTIFYEYYIEWLVAQFQFTILHPKCKVPSNVLIKARESSVFQEHMKSFQGGTSATDRDPFFETITFCAIRSSFAVDMISFCVRAHLYPMKLFLLKTQTMGNILNLLIPNQQLRRTNLQACTWGRPAGDRCLKLAVFRFLRTVLSVNDDMYNRHIIQHNLFQHVFDVFRANPVGDNLVSSTIVEICDFIHVEKISSLIEHIVTKHMMTPSPTSSHRRGSISSLEHVSGPYVCTLRNLRRDYEDSLVEKNPHDVDNHKIVISRNTNINRSRFFCENQSLACNSDDSESYDNNAVTPTHRPQRNLTGKAFEEQRRFREIDEEESYFDS